MARKKSPSHSITPDRKVRHRLSIQEILSIPVPAVVPVCGKTTMILKIYMKTGTMKTSTRLGTNGRKGGKHPSSGVLLLYLFMISRNTTSSAALRMLFIAPTQVI